MPITMRHVAAVGVCMVLATGAAQAADTISWAKTYTGAVTQAKQTHKLIMIDFYTDW